MAASADPGGGPSAARSARPGPGGVHAPAARGAHQQHALFPDGDHGRDGDAGVYYFEYTDTFTVNVQGFFCHDSAYRKPYPGPEDSSAVPPVLLYSLAAGVPVLVVSPGVPALAPTALFRPSPSGLRPR